MSTYAIYEYVSTCIDTQSIQQIKIRTIRKEEMEEATDTGKNVSNSNSN